MQLENGLAILKVIARNTDVQYFVESSLIRVSDTRLRLSSLLDNNFLPKEEFDKDLATRIIIEQFDKANDLL